MKHLQYPKTREEWWNNVNDAWPDLRNIMECYLDMNSHKGDGTHPQDISLRQHIENLKINQDSELARWFSRTWLGAPDNSSIWDLPHWGTLCDLCSEEYVLFPEEGERQ